MIICGDAQQRPSDASQIPLVRLAPRRRDRSQRPDATSRLPPRYRWAMRPMPHPHPPLSTLIEPCLDLLIGHGIELVDDLVLAPLEIQPNSLATSISAARLSPSVKRTSPEPVSHTPVNAAACSRGNRLSQAPKLSVESKISA